MPNVAATPVVSATPSITPGARRRALRWLLGAMLALSACAGQRAVEQPATTPQPGIVSTVSPTAVLTPTPTESPSPTRWPTIEAAEAQRRLTDAYQVVPEEGPGGQAGRRVTGWRDGLRAEQYCEGPYRWLDDGHLLLFPVTGKGSLWSEDRQDIEYTWPVVIDLESGRSWLVPVDRPAWECNLVHWSSGLEAVVTAQGGEILLLDLEGRVKRRYPGGSTPLHLSPSGLRLIAGASWYDLKTGRKVDFPGGWSLPEWDRSSWSSDETRVFRCCFTYGDARTGEGYAVDELDGVYHPGMGLGGGSLLSTGSWVLDGRYFVPWVICKASDPSYCYGLPLVDPAGRSVQDALALAGIAQDPPRLTGYGVPSPDGRLAFVQLVEAGAPKEGTAYLLDLGRLKARPVTGEGSAGAPWWSADSRHVLLRDLEDRYAMVGVEEARLVWFERGIRQAVWAPQGSRLAYLSGDGRRLTVYDAEAGQAQLSLELQAPAYQVIWSPDGSRLAVLGEDGSLWWTGSGPDGRLQALTGPLTGAHTVRWAPGGEAIAVADAGDVYVVSLP